jgi:hypothetical protein
MQTNASYGRMSIPGIVPAVYSGGRHAGQVLESFEMLAKRGVCGKELYRNSQESRSTNKLSRHDQ